MAFRRPYRIVMLAVIHVCAVLVDWWLTGDNLVSAMIFGSKQLDEASASAETPGMVATAGAFLLARTDFAALATTPGEESEHHYEDHD